MLILWWCGILTFILDTINKILQLIKLHIENIVWHTVTSTGTIFGCINTYSILGAVSVCLIFFRCDRAVFRFIRVRDGMFWEKRGPGDCLRFLVDRLRFWNFRFFFSNRFSIGWIIFFTYFCRASVGITTTFLEPSLVVAVLS